MFAKGHDRRHMHRRREHVVGTLAFVHVVIRVNFSFHTAHAAQQLARAVCQHFIHVHVALGAGAGLPDSERKFVDMFIGQHFIGGTNNRRRFFGRQQT
ncbi:hypothetical protein D3C80_1172240 [compost metagenome]